MFDCRIKAVPLGLSHRRKSADVSREKKVNVIDQKSTSLDDSHDFKAPQKEASTTRRPIGSDLALVHLDLQEATLPYCRLAEEKGSDNSLEHNGTSHLRATGKKDKMRTMFVFL